MPVSDYANLFDAAGRQYDVDPRLLAAMATVESNGDPKAVSSAGAQGLMQIMPDTARRLGVSDPFDPKQAIPGAARLMAENLDRYGRPDAALMAYNAGTDPTRWDNPETQGYVPKIIAAFEGAVMPSAVAAEAPRDAFAAAFSPPGESAPGTNTPEMAAALDRARAATGAPEPQDAFSAAFRVPAGSGAGASVAPAGNASRPPSEYKTVPIHPAPDGNGMTNLSDADYADLQRKLAAQNAARPAIAPSTAPVTIDVTKATVPAPALAAKPPLAMIPLTPMDPMTDAALAQTDTGMTPPIAVAGNPGSTPQQMSAITEPATTALNTGAGVLDAFTHGLSMGLDRPLDAAANSLFGNPMQAALQQRRQRFETQHPVLSDAATVVGALPPYLMGEGALAPLVSASGRIATMAASGLRNALLGGASSFGLGNGDFDQRLNQAGQGAIIGATLPPVLSGIGKIAGAPVSFVTNRVAPDRTALSVVGKAIARDQMTPADVTNRLAQLGPNASLADAGGANLLRLGETVANMPGAPAQHAESFLESRMLGQASRLNDAVKAATGSAGDFHAALDKLAADRATAAAPTYAKAFARPLTMAEVRPLQRFIQDPIGQDALQKGMRVVELENLANDKMFDPAQYGVVRGQSGDWILDPDTLKGNKALGMRLLDAVKRGYDEIVEGFRDPTSGKLNLNQYGRAVNDVRAAYVSKLRDLSPDYAKALDTWAGPSRAMDALSMGRQALTADPEVTSKVIGRLSPGEKQFFLSGVARSIRDKIESTPDTADAVRRIFGNDLIRQKIEAAIGSPKAFAEFEKTMEQEAVFAKTRNTVLKGSQTARRLAGQADYEVNLADPILHAASGNFGHAAMSMVRQGINALKRPSEAQGARLGNMLFSPGGATPALNALLARPAPIVRPLVNPIGILGVNQLASAHAQQ